MNRQLTGIIAVIGFLAATLAVLLWPNTGLIHHGPVALIGAGLLAAALFKHHAKRPQAAPSRHS